MGWAFGVDKYGREVGYGVATKCEADGCDKEIDKGLGCRCGGVLNLHEDFGCGRFFCGNHLYFGLDELGKKDQLCMSCFVKEDGHD